MLTVFAICSITMPVMGVAIGSAIVDRLGGYVGPRGVARTLKVCAIFACFACASALSTCFIGPGVHAFPAIVSCISVTLFFGGCVIPSATGVILEVAPPDARAVASAGSIFAFQTFGYALSPLFSALVMQMVGHGGAPSASAPTAAAPNTTAATTAAGAASVLEPHISPTQLQTGFRTVMAWSVFGAVGLLYARRVAVRNLTRKVAAREQRFVTYAQSRAC